MRGSDVSTRGRLTLFVLNGREAVECPSEDARCHDVSYLVPGDQVVLGFTNGGFVCASSSTPRHICISVGCHPEPSFPEPAPTVNLSDWIGHWVAMESDVTIKPAAQPGALSISGDATWGGFDPERVKMRRPYRRDRRTSVAQRADAGVRRNDGTATAKSGCAASGHIFWLATPPTAEA